MARCPRVAFVVHSQTQTTRLQTKQNQKICVWCAYGAFGGRVARVVRVWCVWWACVVRVACAAQMPFSDTLRSKHCVARLIESESQGI
jgi:hypothetical protein